MEEELPDAIDKLKTGAIANHCKETSEEETPAKSSATSKYKYEGSHDDNDLGSVTYEDKEYEEHTVVGVAEEEEVQGDGSVSNQVANTA